MSIASELTNLEGNIEDSYDAVNDMGGIIPAQRNMDNLDQAIRTIPQSQGATYTAGYGIDIDQNDEISVDTTVIAEKTDIPTNTSDLTNDGSDGTSTYVEADDLATVATSGSYDDLLNKPTIPAAQVQSNWTQTTTTAVDYIKNKPTIPTVNNATLTIQKNGTSVGTFTANASSNATANVTVPTKTQLASGGTVTTTTTNLSQAPSNFDYLLVDIVDNDGRIASVWVPNGSPSFSYVGVGYASGLYKKWSGWTISGSKITRAFSAEQFSNNAPYDGSFHGVKRVFGIKIP